jgi:hypothetical protein
MQSGFFAGTPIRCALLLTVATVAILPTGGKSRVDQDSSTVRSEISGMYREWGTARISFDEEVVERILAPEFYLLVDGERLTREEFVDEVTDSRRSGAGRLTRFDADVLTVQQTEGEWTVVIAEKVEYELLADDGGTKTAYGYWVTRDGCRKEGNQWLVTYSEAIGYERWKGGATPPIENW